MRSAEQEDLIAVGALGAEYFGSGRPLDVRAGAEKIAIELVEAAAAHPEGFGGHQRGDSPLTEAG